MTAELCDKNAIIPSEIFYTAMLLPYGCGRDPHEDNPLLAMKAADSDPDTMYHHKAMREPDKENFKEAMQQEWDGQVGNGNFSLVE